MLITLIHLRWIASTILDKIVQEIVQNCPNLMIKFHVPCKNIVHPPPPPPPSLAQCCSWWKNLRTCLAQHWFGGEGGWRQWMRRKNNYLVAVANNGKLRQRFTPGVPRTFDQDCSIYLEKHGGQWRIVGLSGDRGGQCTIEKVYCIRYYKFKKLFWILFKHFCSTILKHNILVFKPFAIPEKFWGPPEKTFKNYGEMF